MNKNKINTTTTSFSNISITSMSSSMTITSMMNVPLSLLFVLPLLLNIAVFGGVSGITVRKGDS